ncbi:MAG: hypothetical protein CL609_16850 [Anaerolineaceae bacterium]|nr:hypothetical protein [Anaerolineaceae bacterium]
MTIRFHKVWLLGILMILVLTACQPAEPLVSIEKQIEEGKYRVVTVQELAGMLTEKDFFLVNVHIPWEGDIPQTDLRLAYDQIDQNLDQLPEKKEKILVYCYTSGMAKSAVKTLLAQGYTDVWMLDGGTGQWVAEGYTLEK